MTSSERLRRPLTTLVVLAAALLPLSCGSATQPDATDGAPSTSPSRSATRSSTPSTTAPAVTGAVPVTTPPSLPGRTMTVTIKGRTVTPLPGRIDLAVGERIAITLISDHDDTLHAHGFEVEQELKAGAPTTVTLTGKAPGLYDVETHHPELRILQVAVR